MQNALVVDDDEVALAATLHLVEERGLHVFPARNAPQAIALLQADNAIDVVITEVVLPEISGWEVFIAARARSSSIPVLFVTDFIPKILRNRARLDGFAEVVDKPLTGEQLEAAFNAILAGSSE